MAGRVLRVITRLTVSGPSTHVLLLDRGLAERGWETLLVYGSVEEGETEMDLATVDVPARHLAPLRRSIRPADDARTLASLARLMRSYRPDIVHTHQSKAGLLGRLAATVTRVPSRVHTFHGNVFEGYFSPRTSALVMTAERLAALETTRTIVLSDEQRRELAERRIGRRDRVRVIPLGLELERFAGHTRSSARAELGLDQAEVVLVAAGRLAQIKRIDRLLRVFAAVHAAHPETRLCVVGDGPLRPELEAQTASLGLGDAVRFAGWSDAMPVWHAAADIVVNSSDSEGTPLVLIEAAASARPAVATRVGGVPDVVIEGVTGWLVDREDEAAFAERIGRLVRDPEMRRRFGDEAFARRQTHDASRLVDDVAGLYAELLASDGRRR
jgi:glycosyltransferase involved in cell wall biosynthesis